MEFNQRTFNQRMPRKAAGAPSAHPEAAGAGQAGSGCGEQEAQETFYGVALLDSQGLIRSFNDDFLSMSERPRFELFGIPASNLFPELPLSSYSEAFNRSLVNRKFAGHDWLPFDLQRQNGERLPVELRLGVIRLRSSNQVFILETSGRAAGGRA